MVFAIRMNDALLPLLPSLVTLIEEGRVGGAAKRLGISQPRMSARLATLRALLDDPILVSASGRRGLIATDRARRLAEAARRTLADLDTAIVSNGFDPRNAVRTFAVMANDNAAVIIGLPLVDAVRSAAGPSVRIAFHQFDPARLGDLESGRLDLALGAPAQFERMPGLKTRTVVRDRFVSAVQGGEQFVGDLDSYCARDHVLVSGDGGGFDGLVDHALAVQGRSRRVALSVQNYLLAIEAVATSDLVATLPRILLTASRRDLTMSDPPLALPAFTLASAWHTRADADPAHRWLREQLDVVRPR
ncbi:LysR family transcriptional regulator [Sphingomonas sp. XXL09]|uniref:LysR family transcriptional regulator n=1 Tax=Sphingomonas sp. XXL09 TaxID=3457787 RepID=UPI00406BDA48